MAVILTLLLMILFAIGGYAVDTSFYLLRRQQVQSLAESVALGAASTLPLYDETEDVAENWFAALRVDETGHEIAPETGALTVSLNDNRTSASADVAYKVSSLGIKITTEYDEKFLPIVGSSIGSISVVGKSSVHLVPTDIVLIVDNTASFLSVPAGTASVAKFTAAYPTVASQYAEQCFSTPWLNFKKGLLQLYDQLSQIETFRVAIVTTTSASGDPYVLAELGETELTGEDLENPVDFPDYHNSRCAAGTVVGEYPVPAPANAGAHWSPRTNLTTLLDDFTNGDLEIATTKPILTREAIWLMQAGYSTDSGYIHPRYYYASPIPAIEIARDILRNSRRDDNLPVVHRWMILLTDDNGTVPDYFINPETPDDTEVTQDPCDFWVNDASNTTPGADGASFRDQMDLGVVYYGWNTTLENHSPSDAMNDIPAFRTNCLASSFIAENSSFATPVGFYNVQTKFETYLAPLLAHSFKGVEVRK